ncbi:MAG: TonB-dependent receptor plug domain-containing protein [Butyricimonas paravirosa]
MKKIYHTSNCFKRFENYLKFSLVSLAILFTALPANATADGTKLTLSFKDSNLPAILKEIKNQTKYDFMYNSKEIDTNKKISMELKNVTLDSALKVCLTPFGLTYTIKDKIIILKKKTLDHITQVIQSMVNGIVKDKSGATLPGVAVVLKGSVLGTVTDLTDGLKSTSTRKEYFKFTYRDETRATRSRREQFVNVTMEEDVAELDEVIVTGMETVKRDYMTGSASVITAKDLRTQGISSIDRILEGTIAGLNSTTLSGAPGTRAKITIRGENNLTGRTEPLWIVDGLPLMSGVPENNTGDYAGTIMQDGVGNIMPEDIESVTILKDASAAAIYGAKAANGVIVITTKKGFRSKTQFNYTGNYSLAEAPRLHMDFMNSREKLQYERIYWKLTG